jgi:hypothetical protein
MTDHLCVLLVGDGENLHGGNPLYCGLFGGDTVSSSKLRPMFWRNIVSSTKNLETMRFSEKSESTYNPEAHNLYT